MKMTDAKPAEHIGLDLNFTAPLEAHNRTDFDFAKTSGGSMKKSSAEAAAVDAGTP